MLRTACVLTILGWIVGLFLDANISLTPIGFLGLRFLLPILAMGLCILYAISHKKPHDGDDSDQTPES